MTLSKYKINERYTAGYMLNSQFRAMPANRSFDPFAPSGSQTDTTKQLIQDSLFKGSIREAYSDMKGFDVRGSREVFTLPGGAASVAVGADDRQLQQVQTASGPAKNGIIYGFSAPAENDWGRTLSLNSSYTFQAFPLSKNLDGDSLHRTDPVAHRHRRAIRPGTISNKKRPEGRFSLCGECGGGQQGGRRSGTPPVSHAYSVTRRPA